MHRVSHIRRTCLAWRAVCSFLLIGVPTLLQAQNEPALPRWEGNFTLFPAGTDSTIMLPHRLIAEGSDTLRLATGELLRRGEQYTLSYPVGRLNFPGPFLDSLHDGPVTVNVSFLYLPLALEEVYARRTPVVLKDSTGRDTMVVARPEPRFRMEDIFGPNLQKSGSIVRGFTVATNRDLSLNSGLRLQLAGRIAPEIEVAAALTDENTPIQPEGTTQTLQEFDKVFVEIRSPSFGATLGDFFLTLKGTEFARLDRKLQGAQGTAVTQPGRSAGGALIAGAVTRGKYATNQFLGLEGVQGPYRLRGRNGEQLIIVIAGTERVYIDGEEQTRGETQDYTIDYSLGEITFTPNRLITAASRITVDFEYTDRQYTRSLVATQGNAQLWDSTARFSITFLREADDPDAPIDLILSDEARRVLQEAGSDRSKAFLNGVTQVDSNGLYRRIDTLLAAGDSVSIYRYAPGDPSARYIVSFSYVGPGQGDYVRRQAGVFEWRGPRSGDYLPVQLIPLPESRQVVDGALTIAPVSDLSLSAEFAASQFDANRLSSLAETERAGGAYTLSAAYAPETLTIAGLRLGGAAFRYRERYVGQSFVPLDRTDEIEFGRKWGLDTLRASQERIREFTASLKPLPGLSAGGGYGSIRRGEDASSTRINGFFGLAGAGLPSLSYSAEDVRTSDRALDLDSRWFRHRGSVDYRLGSLTPGFQYEGERRILRPVAGGAVKPGSFRFNQFALSLAAADLGPASLRGSWMWRADDAVAEGELTRESSSFTQSYAAMLNRWQDLQSSLDVTLRTRKFTDAFRGPGREDVQTVLVRSQTRYSPLAGGLSTDFFYEVATQQSSRFERVFVRVARGQGNYRYLGDLNSNGIADENEFVPARFDGDFIAVTVPAADLVPVIDLKASVRLRIAPSRFLPKGGWLFSVLSALSTETYARVDEKSTERDLKKIYLLHFSRFQNDSTTLNGSSVFTQDLHLFEGRPAFSSRFRFSQRRGLTGFGGQPERTYGRDRSVRLRFQLVPELSQQLEYINRTDRLTGGPTPSRVRDVMSDAVVLDISYRPEQQVELGMTLQVAAARDRSSSAPLEADLNTQGVRFVQALERAGQIRLEVSREEVLLRGQATVVPYELTGGRVPGKTWLWRAALEYRITDFLQASANYDGRVEGGGSPVHTARAEVRAFF